MATTGNRGVHLLLRTVYRIGQVLDDFRGVLLGQLDRMFASSSAVYRLCAVEVILEHGFD